MCNRCVCVPGSKYQGSTCEDCKVRTGILTNIMFKFTISLTSLQSVVQSNGEKYIQREHSCKYIDNKVENIVDALKEWLIYYLRLLW